MMTDEPKVGVATGNSIIRWGHERAKSKDWKPGDVLKTLRRIPLGIVGR